MSNHTPDIELSRRECSIARYIGKVRRELSLQRPGKRDRMGSNSKLADMLNTEIQAFGAELAVAKYLNLYPDITAMEYKDADLLIGDNVIDVKHTQYPEGNLAVHEAKFNRYYVSVSGSIPRFRIFGYLAGPAVTSMGLEVTDDNPEKCYWLIPAQYLKDIDDLKEILNL